MTLDSFAELVRSTGLIGVAVAGGAAMVLGAVLGVLVMARRSSGSGGGARSAALDDALAATGSATIGLRLRGDGVEVTDLSESVESLTGYTAEGLRRGDAFLRMLDEHEAGELERKIVSAMRDERAMVADFSYEDAEGRSRWMQLRAEPTEGRSSFRGIVREITESRRSQHEVISMSSRFHALADATPAMLWVLDASGAATAVNRATERFCGVSEAALLGEGWVLAVEESHQAGLRQFVARVLDEGMSLNREVVMIDPDNRERRIAMTATVAKDGTGVVESVVLTGRDVTDRSAAEMQRERLTRLVDSIESPAMILSPDLRVSMMNPSARALAGLADGESADSIALWHVVTQEAVDKIRGEATRYCRDGGVFTTRASVRDGADGSLSADFSVVGLGEDWLGVSVKIVEEDLAREAEAQLDRRRLDVMLGALERLTGEGWAPGRAAERLCEAIAGAYEDLRVSFGSIDAGGVLTCEASDEPAWMGAASGRELAFDADGSVLASLRAGETVLIGDVWAESQLAGGAVTCEEYATRRMALRRVDAGDGTLCAMSIERGDEGRWAADELQALELASRMLGLALRAERDRRARDEAETAAAEQTQRWREERDRSDGLAQLAADRVSESERLLHRLQKSDRTWSSALVELGRKASAANGLADEVRDAGLKRAAEQLSRLAHEADRAEIAGRIVSGTLAVESAPFSPREVLRSVGQRVLWDASSRGVSLRISQEGKLPESMTSDERLFRLACAELLAVAVERCSAKELRAVVGMSGGDDEGGPSLVTLRVTGGPVSAPNSNPSGAPGGVALLREIAGPLGGSFEVIERGTGSELVFAAAVELSGAGETGDTGGLAGGTPLSDETDLLDTDDLDDDLTRAA